MRLKNLFDDQCKVEFGIYVKETQHMNLVVMWRLRLNNLKCMI